MALFVDTTLPVAVLLNHDKDISYECMREGLVKLDYNRGKMDPKTIGAAAGGVVGAVLLVALPVFVLYIVGRQYNVSLGEIFGQIRDGFRDSKPKLQ